MGEELRLQEMMGDNMLNLSIMPWNVKDLQLCLDCGISYLIVHHFGMFDFNTVDSSELQAKIEKISGPVHILVPDIDTAYCFAYFMLFCICSRNNNVIKWSDPSYW